MNKILSFVEKFREKYELDIPPIPCVKCGTDLVLDIPELSKDYAFLCQSPCGNCGNNQGAATGVPISKKEIKEWKELLNE